jgi:hypothetical protein
MVDRANSQQIWTAVKGDGCQAILMANPGGAHAFSERTRLILLQRLQFLATRLQLRPYCQLDFKGEQARARRPNPPLVRAVKSREC